MLNTTERPKLQLSVPILEVPLHPDTSTTGGEINKHPEATHANNNHSPCVVAPLACYWSFHDIVSVQDHGIDPDVEPAGPAGLVGLGPPGLAPGLRWDEVEAAPGLIAGVLVGLLSEGVRWPHGPASACKNLWIIERSCRQLHIVTNALNIHMRGETSCSNFDIESFITGGWGMDRSVKYWDCLRWSVFAVQLSTIEDEFIASTGLLDVYLHYILHFVSRSLELVERAWWGGSLGLNNSDCLLWRINSKYIVVTNL